MRILRGPLPSVRDLSNESSVNRPVTRRIIVTGRRPPLDSRSLPTPPPSFLRPWMRREIPLAQTQDYAEEAKRSKQKLLTQLAQARRRGTTTPTPAATTTTTTTTTPTTTTTTTSESESIKKDSSSYVSKDEPRGKEVTRIKKIKTRLDSPETKLSNTETAITQAEDTEIGDQSWINSNDSLKLLHEDDDPVSSFVSKKLVQNTDGKGKSSDNNVSVVTVTPAASALLSTTGKPTNNEILKTDPVQQPEITTFRATTTTDSKENVSTLGSEKVRSRKMPSVLTTSTTTTTIAASTSSPSELKTTSSTVKLESTTAEISHSKPYYRSPSWLMRRRASYMKEMTLKSDQQTQPESEKDIRPQSIIDRVLNSTVSRNSKDDAEKKSDNKRTTIYSQDNFGPLQKNNTQDSGLSKEEFTFLLHSTTTIPTPTKITTDTTTSTLESSTTKATTKPSARQRIPIRVRRPVVSNPLVSTTTTTNPDANSSVHTESLLIPASNRDSEESKIKDFFSTNAITSSTPKFPLTYGDYLSPLSGTGGDHLESIFKRIKYLSPKSTVTTRQVTPEDGIKRVTPLEESFRTPLEDGLGLAPLEERPTATAVPRMKSPQDIVLEKLSELMKNATDKSKDSLDDIAREIERLNEELASMGIHIIDAEFDGRKIKLKDNVDGKIPNFLSATTIRYIIPNSKNRLNSQKENILSNSSKRSEESRVIPNTQRPDIMMASKTTEKSLFTLTHSDSSFPDIRDTAPSSSSGLTESNYSSNHSNFLSTPTHTDLLTRSPVTVRTVLEKEKFRNYESIATSTTISAMDSTRTRSTTVPISIIEQTKNPDTSMHSASVDSSFHSIRATATGTPTNPKFLNPTAHLRPSTNFTGVSAPSDTQNSASAETSNHSHSAEKTTYNGIKMVSYENEDSESPLTLLISEADETGTENLSDNETPVASTQYVYLIGILGIIPCIAALVFLYRQRQNREKHSLPEREERADGFTPPVNHTKVAGHNDTLDAFPGYMFEVEARESPWELSRSKLRLNSIIGEGNFGIVWKAEARQLCEWEEDGGPTVLVAVKGVKEGAGAKEKKDLLRELSIMQHLGQHSNIVTLLGCCTKQEPFYLVMEYVMFGKLLEFLRDQRSKNNYLNFSSDADELTSRDLTKFACQIATGCEYLQARGVIHRDLAARNILLDHNKVCKIADFGMARSVIDLDNDIYEQKSKGPLPIRWMAPESLYMNIYTHKSDVWSFGILCWEIVTLGSTPYPGISAREVMRRVREGYRLERPEHCRPEFYRIVSKCWHQDIKKRASFTTVRKELEQLLDNPSGWIDLENFQEATYYSMHQNNDEKL